MEDNKLIIDELKKDLINLGNIIRRSDRLIMSLNNTDMQDQYRHQLLIMVDQYYELEQLLKSMIDDYMEWEKENGLAVDFTIRKLQKQLEEK